MDIQLLKDADKAIAALVGSVKTFAESVRDAVKAGLDITDMVRVRRAEKALRTVILYSRQTGAMQVAVLLTALDAFIRQGNQAAWDRVRYAAGMVLDQVEDLAAALHEYGTNAVLDPAFNKLYDSLTARQVHLANVLNQAHAPDDLEAVRRFRDQYAQLVAALEEAADALATFAKDAERAG